MESFQRRFKILCPELESGRLRHVISDQPGSESVFPRFRRLGKPYQRGHCQKGGREARGGRSLPCINTLVDAYNLASIKTGIAIAAFDADRLQGDLTMRYAEEDEKFLGIGMKKPALLQGGEIVVQDREKLVAIYPYRDADDSKVTEATRNVLLLFCGVPGISVRRLTDASKVASEYITRFCGAAVRAKNPKKS